MQAKNSKRTFNVKFVIEKFLSMVKLGCLQHIAVHNNDASTETQKSMTKCLFRKEIMTLIFHILFQVARFLRRHQMR